MEINKIVNKCAEPAKRKRLCELRAKHHGKNFCGRQTACKMVSVQKPYGKRLPTSREASSNISGLFFVAGFRRFSSVFHDSAWVSTNEPAIDDADWIRGKFKTKYTRCPLKWYMCQHGHWSFQGMCCCRTCWIIKHAK